MVAFIHFSTISFLSNEISTLRENCLQLRGMIEQRFQNKPRGEEHCHEPKRHPK